LNHRQLDQLGENITRYIQSGQQGFMITNLPVEPFYVRLALDAGALIVHDSTGTTLSWKRFCEEILLPDNEIRGPVNIQLLQVTARGLSKELRPPSYTEPVVMREMRTGAEKLLPAPPSHMEEVIQEAREIVGAISNLHESDGTNPIYRQLLELDIGGIPFREWMNPEFFEGQRQAAPIDVERAERHLKLITGALPSSQNTLGLAFDAQGSSSGRLQIFSQRLLQYILQIFSQ